ncbi:MAG: TIGR04283 family arsenosugar biosynthesis glycosyltransferase [Verrucomicrobiia bacterium]
MFARFPEPGCVKTRLIPALGAEGAAALHRRLVLRTLRTALAAGRAADAELEIRFTGGDENAMRHWLGDEGICRAQSEGDLGRRMADAFEDSFREGARATVIIGSDCPELTADLLAAAFDKLSRTSVVFGPARDGGYYLVGLTQPVPQLFRDIHWSTETVLTESVCISREAGFEPTLLTSLSDLDVPGDLYAWKLIADAEDAGLSRISVIIPALNEAQYITATMQSAQRGRPCEILVVDGGSADDTVALARAAGARVIHSQPGRARQMNAGAAQATGHALVFLHADTLLPADYPEVVAGTLRDPAVTAGAFRFRMGEKLAGQWLIEWTANQRSRWRQSPYGDQALFLRRSLFEEIGGFAGLPIMEDCEIVRRLRKRGRVITVAAAAITSGRRWRRLGLFRTTLINKLVILGYLCGVSPDRLAAFYRGQEKRIRKS